ncbi:MAG: hypothetical protein H0U23_06905 [Blastocatellia bacterium]|nr:hypothetical protein [Blastocatellia bacterium]
MAVYQVVGGAQSGTYLIFIPWDSLTRAETIITHGKSYQDALGEDRRDKIEKIENDSVVFSAIEIYAFNPQLSFAPPAVLSSFPAALNSNKKVAIAFV